jgi:8-oxo-dGTP diphosphatase
MIRVVAAVIAHRGRALICQRRRGDPFELQWEFPGGKIRRGETPRIALARELREELGIAVTIGREIYRTRHCYTDRDISVELTFFAASRPFPAPRNIVFERIAWAWPADLGHYNFLAADRRLVSRLMRGEFECFGKDDTSRKN